VNWIENWCFRWVFFSVVCAKPLRMYTSFNVRELVCLPDGGWRMESKHDDVVVGCRGGLDSEDSPPRHVGIT
jgi:hypothetical protein